MTKEEIRFRILQTLIKGRYVYIKDTEEPREHILGRDECNNLNVINWYIEQLDYENIISWFQETEEDNLYIETKNKLKFIWEEL